MKLVGICVGLAFGLGLLAYEFYIFGWLVDFIEVMLCTY